jgi:hypothetical protein
LANSKKQRPAFSVTQASVILAVASTGNSRFSITVVFESTDHLLPCRFLGRFGQLIESIFADIFFSSFPSPLFHPIFRRSTSSSPRVVPILKRGEDLQIVDGATACDGIVKIDLPRNFHRLTSYLPSISRRDLSHLLDHTDIDGVYRSPVQSGCKACFPALNSCRVGSVEFSALKPRNYLEV